MLISLYTYTHISSINHTLSKTERFGPNDSALAEPAALNSGSNGRIAGYPPPPAAPPRGGWGDAGLIWHIEATVMLVSIVLQHLSSIEKGTSRAPATRNAQKAFNYRVFPQRQIHIAKISVFSSLQWYIACISNPGIPHSGPIPQSVPS